LRVLRDRLRTAVNALDTYERLEIAAAWGADASERKRESALRTIERSVLDAADAIGVNPSEKQLYVDIINRLQEENKRVTEANVRIIQNQQRQETTA
jgi:hypothetical protein